MDDRHYIAKLERMLEERKDIINTLITICGDLVEERDKLSDYADRCLRDRVNESELLRMEQERFDALIEDYHCLDQRFCTEVRDHQEAQHKIKRLEGMVERRDKKIKDLTVERDVIKDACEDCSCVNELLSGYKYLKEEIKHLNAIVDGAS